MENNSQLTILDNLDHIYSTLSLRYKKCTVERITFLTNLNTLKNDWVVFSYPSQNEGFHVIYPNLYVLSLLKNIFSRLLIICINRFSSYANSKLIHIFKQKINSNQLIIYCKQFFMFYSKSLQKKLYSRINELMRKYHD